MKTIWVRITDGKNVTAVSTEKKTIAWIKDGNPDMTDKEAREILNDEWQEIRLNYYA